MTFDQTILHCRWLHSHEEDVPGKKVFRPDSYAWPPSRGRFGYEFRPDGRVLRLAPGPTDKPTADQGTWTADAEGQITIHIPGRQDEVLEIDTLDPDRLVVKRPQAV